ncbi:MAG: hypothetical protein F6K49_41535 [Moorea sp. SIO3I6]|nr:hypothetical protein [Moorena sp. SIO3I6]
MIIRRWGDYYVAIQDLRIQIYKMSLTLCSLFPVPCSLFPIAETLDFWFNCVSPK